MDIVCQSPREAFEIKKSGDEYLSALFAKGSKDIFELTIFSEDKLISQKKELEIAKNFISRFKIKPELVWEEFDKPSQFVLEKGKRYKLSGMSFGKMTYVFQMEESPPVRWRVYCGFDSESKKIKSVYK